MCNASKDGRASLSKVEVVQFCCKTMYQEFNRSRDSNLCFRVGGMYNRVVSIGNELEWM